MSRTIRKRPYSKFLYRYPKSTNEKSKLNEILNDPELKDFPLTKRNRMQSRGGKSGELPTAYDDIFPTYISKEY
jgi:hypothetical protein